jgi:mevalonate kinase
MLLGEYAVLAGKPAIVCAIDKFIQVTLQPRQDQQIHIQSALGTLTTPLASIVMQSPFEYVLTALTLKRQLPSGCDILITGDCESGIGLGSSAAVTVATLAAVHAWLEKTVINAENLWHQAMAVIQHIQGKGSGADLAASIYGGVIAFQNNPLQVERIASTLPICAIYSGKKLITAHAIDQMNQKRQQQPAFFAALDEAIAQLSLSAIPAIKNQDWQTLGALFNEAQKIMVKMGVSNELLNALIDTLRNYDARSLTVALHLPHSATIEHETHLPMHAPHFQAQHNAASEARPLGSASSFIFGAKISGSGLGDCVIGLGNLPQNIFPLDAAQQTIGVRQIPLTITASGVGIG